jgi:hypothetical protein
MIALVRSRMTSERTAPTTWRTSAEQSPAEGAGSSTIRLTTWTRDETVCAELFRAPVPVAAGTATRVHTGDLQDADEHLFADADEVEPSWLWAADVIVRRGDAAAEGAAERRLPNIFRSFPGCLIAGVLGPDNVCAVGSRNGWSTQVVGRPAHGMAPGVLGWYVSLVHGWAASGRSLTALTDAVVTVSVQTATGPGPGQNAHESYGRVISVIRSNS